MAEAKPHPQVFDRMGSPRPRNVLTSPPAPATISTERIRIQYATPGFFQMLGAPVTFDLLGLRAEYPAPNMRRIMLGVSSTINKTGTDRNVIPNLISARLPVVRLSIRCSEIRSQLRYGAHKIHSFSCTLLNCQVVVDSSG